MARGINKVILIGNCGADPETRYLTNGGAVTNITVATSESWKDRETGQQNERTEWHRVVFFRRLAEIAGEDLKKGSKVYIEGSLRTNQWERDGQKHYTTEIIADQMQMLDSRGSSGGGAGGTGGGYGDDSYGNSGNSGPGAPQDTNQPMQSNPDTSASLDQDFDDDIPF